LGQNPGHNLLAEKHEFPARPGAKVRQALAQQPLPYTPGRAAEQTGDLSDAHGFTQLEVLASIWGGFWGG